MYYLNKFVWVLMNPAMVGLLILCAAVVWRKRWMIAAALGWIYLWSIPFTSNIVGGALELPYANQVTMKVEDFPQADAIADLGGGVGYRSSMFAYAQLNSSADRALHSARLWKAGKAPIVIPSGAGCGDADAEVLRELGVPQEAIVVENEARNTEENAKLIAERLVGVGEMRGTKVDEGLDSTVPLEIESPTKKPKVLVVTSAWHMKRAMLMFEKYAPNIDAIPVICDVECVGFAALAWQNFIPSFDSAGANARYLHEWIGIIGYKWFRK